MKKIILLLSFMMGCGFAIGQTAPIKKKNYVDEQRILNVEAATPRAGYISAPYRKTDGNWYEKTDAGVEQLIIDTVAMLSTKYDLTQTQTQTSNRKIEIPFDVKIDSFSLNKYIIDSSITVNIGDILVQKGKYKPIQSSVYLDGGESKERYAAFPALWKTNNSIYITYREAKSHIEDGNVYFSKSYNNGISWNRILVAANPDLVTDYGLSNSGLYVNDTGRIYITYRNGIGYNGAALPPFIATNNFYKYSDDNGETWSTAVAINTDSTNTILSETHLLKKGNRVFQPYYYLKSDGRNIAGVAYTDTEDFANMTFVDIPTVTPTATQNETALIQLGDTLVAFIRTSAPGESRITRSTSIDNGVSWSTPISIIYPDNFTVGNGGHPNCLLLPNNDIIIHARDGVEQLPSILISSDMGYTFNEYILTKDVELASMYMDFAIVSDNKIGVAHAHESNGGGLGTLTALYYSTIDLPKETSITKTENGYTYESSASIGNGLEVSDVIQSTYFKDSDYDSGVAFKNSKVLDIGYNNQLIIGDKASQDLLIVNGQSNPKIAIGGTSVLANNPTGKILDIYGQLGVGNKDNSTILIGHDAAPNLITGLRAVAIGISAANNVTTLQQSTVIGESVGRAATSINTSLLQGYRAAEQAQTISNSLIFGDRAFNTTTGSVTGIVNFGNSNARNGSGTNKVLFGNNNSRYHTGNNVLFIGNNLITGSTNLENSLSDYFILGMDSNRAIEGSLLNKYTQINNVLRLTDGTSQPVGYTETGGDIRWNSSLLTHEGYNGTTWESFGGGGGGGGSASTIYTADGTLAENRTVTMATNDLILTGGNVGIGTTPTADLHVQGKMYNTYSGGGDVFEINTTDGNDPAFITMRAPNAQGGEATLTLNVEDDLSTPNKSIVRFQSSGNGSWGAFGINPNGGNVIIGSVADLPTASLQVVTATGVQIENTFGGEEIRLNPNTNADSWINVSGKNFGIGTTTPDAKLDVENGTVRFSDYGSGTTTGTETYLLGVESDGDVVEVDLASGMDAVVSSRSYVDNTAALVDLVSGQVYYNTTSSIFVVLP